MKSKQIFSLFAFALFILFAGNSCSHRSSTDADTTTDSTTTAYEQSLLIHPEELSLKWIDRMHTLGINTITLHPRGGRNAYKTLEEMLQMLETEEFKAMLDHADSLGLNIEYEFHAASYLLPRDLYESHPEYFRMNADGQREQLLNFCVSNEEALDIVAKRAVELAKKLYKSTHRYYFWMDDVKESTCQCEKCAQLSESDMTLLVMNRIIKELRKEIPDAQLAYLAYHGAMPTPTQVTPAEGIFVEYAPIDRDLKCRLRENNPDEENIKALLNFFGKKNAKVLEYWYDNSMMSNWTKPPKQFTPDNDLIRDDMDYYRQLGFNYISSFACFLGADYEELYGEPDVSAFSMK